MGQPAPRMPHLTVEEYLEFEEKADVKHEYVGGQIHAMSGVTKRHNLISLNLASELRSANRGSGCRVYAMDVKVRAAPDVIYYPDLMVACGADRGTALIEEAPCLVVEVLSPSTSSIDRREKLLTYRQMESLEAYLIVAQDERRVDRHWRDERGEWRAEAVEGVGEVRVRCPVASLSLDAIYEGTGV